MSVIGQPVAAADRVAVSPGGALIAGTWRTAPLDLSVHDPENVRIVGWVARCSAQDVDEAVRAAARSLGEDWPLHTRSKALHRAADLVLERAGRFAQVISAEGVKTLAEARAKVNRCVETLRVASASGDVLTGQVLQLDAIARGDGVQALADEPTHNHHELREQDEHDSQ